MKIQVLGSGCPTCKKLFELTKEAASQLQLNAEVEYITDISKIIEMGVMSSPVLAINGKPTMVGFLPKTEAIKDVLQQSVDNKKNNRRQPLKCKCGGECS